MKGVRIPLADAVPLLGVRKRQPQDRDAHRDDADPVRRVNAPPRHEVVHDRHEHRCEPERELRRRPCERGWIADQQARVVGRARHRREHDRDAREQDESFVDLGLAAIRDGRAEKSAEQQHVAERNRKILGAGRVPEPGVHVDDGHCDRHDQAQYEHEHAVADSRICRPCGARRSGRARRVHGLRDQQHEPADVHRRVDVDDPRVRRTSDQGAVEAPAKPRGHDRADQDREPDVEFAARRARWPRRGFRNDSRHG